MKNAIIWEFDNLLVREVIESNNIDATIIKVTDFQEIMKYGVMTTPAFVVNEKVIIKGRIATTEEIRNSLI